MGFCAGVCKAASEKRSGAAVVFCAGACKAASEKRSGAAGGFCAGVCKADSEKRSGAAVVFCAGSCRGTRGAGCLGFFGEVKAWALFCVAALSGAKGEEAEVLEGVFAKGSKASWGTCAVYEGGCCDKLSSIEG